MRRFACPSCGHPPDAEGHGGAWFRQRPYPAQTFVGGTVVDPATMWMMVLACEGGSRIPAKHGRMNSLEECYAVPEAIRRGTTMRGHIDVGVSGLLLRGA